MRKVKINSGRLLSLMLSPVPLSEIEWDCSKKPMRNIIINVCVYSELHYVINPVNKNPVIFHDYIY